MGNGGEQYGIQDTGFTMGGIQNIGPGGTYYNYEFFRIHAPVGKGMGRRWGATMDSRKGKLCRISSCNIYSPVGVVVISTPWL